MVKTYSPVSLTEVCFYLITYVFLFFCSFMGLFCRKSYDKKANTSALQLLTGSSFISLATTSFYSFFPFIPLGAFAIISAVLGYGSKNFFSNLSNNEVWRKYDIFSRIDIVKKFFPDADEAEKKDDKK